MSNGVVHDRLTKQISIPASLLLGVSVFPIVGITGSLLAVLSCFIGIQIQRSMTPDLDVDDGNYSFYLLRKINPILSNVLQYYWKIYALAIKHRSFISHSPIISTVIRFIYGMWYLVFIWRYIVLYWDFFLYIFIGMCIADMGHLMLDFIYPFRYFYEKIYDK